MKESYREGLASHPDPESCRSGRKAEPRSVDRGTDRQGKASSFARGVRAGCGVRLQPWCAGETSKKSRMKESYREGLASHPDPESCRSGRKAEPRSVDRGTDRQGYRAPKTTVLERRRSQGMRKATRARSLIARARPARRSRRSFAHVWKLLAREPGGPGGAGGVRNRRPERERDE